MLDKLRFAYNTNGAANHRLEDAITLIAEAGYDGIALTLDHHHLDPFASNWDMQATQLARQLKELNLDSVIETGARYLLDFRHKHEPTLLNPDPEGRAQRVAFLKRAIDIAAILGSETVSFWAGVPQTGVDQQQAWDWLEEGITRVCDYGKAHGVPVSLEPEPGMLVEKLSDYTRLVNLNPSLKLALDLGHCLVTQDVDPADAVMQYADKIGTVSIEDMKRGIHVHLPFGEGDMDVRSVLIALNAIRFQKLICVELSRESPRAHEAIPEAIGFLRAIQT